jgi:16S rRNA (cytidine1402-2'-O)-methyltransferase
LSGGMKEREKTSAGERSLPKGTLYVVATPIGNLEDITARAVYVLKSVDLIACEDTRKSLVLLRRWGISTEMMSLHRFSESRRVQTIMQWLEQGRNVALISDAGTPAVSDPGSRLVKAVLDSDFKVTPVPGPSSIIAALSVAGMDASTFVFLGFAPRKNEQRRTFFEDVRATRRTSVFLETPKRIVETLRIAADVLGDRSMILMRELTKVYEEILPGTAASLLRILEARQAVKGEFVVVVEGQAETPAEFDLEEAVRTLVKEGFSGKRLADEAAGRFGAKKGAAYKTFLRMRGNSLE